MDNGNTRNFEPDMSNFATAKETSDSSAPEAADATRPDNLDNHDPRDIGNKAISSPESIDASSQPVTTPETSTPGQEVDPLMPPENNIDATGNTSTATPATPTNNAKFEINDKGLDAGSITEVKNYISKFNRSDDSDPAATVDFYEGVRGKDSMSDKAQASLGRNIEERG